MSAPMRRASARRAGEKSAAITGPMPCSFSAAITASPIGPQPITSATSSGVMRAKATACTPTASGSTSAAWSGSMPAGSGSSMRSASGRYSAKAPGTSGL